MHRTALRATALAFLLGSTAALAQTATPAADPALEPKPASAATIAAQQAVAKSLPADDGRDAEFAKRGFVATRDDPLIRNKQGRPV